ncbi:MAG TPA: O-antigen ligase family protein [Anaerolineaceae bacterium]
MARERGISIDAVHRSTVLNIQPILSQAARVFGWLAGLSLSGMIFLIPFRTAWIWQLRTVPAVYSLYTSLVVYPSDYALVAALAFWGLSLTCRPRAIRLRPVGLTLALAALVGVAAVSTLSSVDRVYSLYQSGRLILLFGLYVYLLNEVRSLWVIFAAAGAQVALQSWVAIGQILRQHSLGLTALHELNLDPAWSGVSVVVDGSLRSLRAYGLSEHPNILGGCLALALLLLLAWHLKIGAGWKLLSGGLVLTGATALFLTFSRSAWLGLAGGLVLFAGWLAARRRWDALLQTAVLGLACLIFLAPFAWQDAGLLGVRLGQNGSFLAATTENQSINERVLLARMAFDIFASHPLTGVGVGGFPEMMHLVSPHYPFNFQPPHQVLLDLAAETGAFGALAYLAALIFPWVALVIRRRRMRFSIELAAVSAGVAAISIISLLDYYPWILNPGQLWLWLLWGLWGKLFVDAQVEPAYE